MQGANKGLEEELASARTYREDFSEVLLRDARARLEGLQDSLGVGSGEDPEVHKILESLVADNEAIKRDNAERTCQPSCNPRIQLVADRKTQLSPESPHRSTRRLADC